jgi:hypothetical protein
MVKWDHPFTLRMMSDELNVNKEIIHQILHEDLQKRKICAIFVPHSLTKEKKQRRLTSCQYFIQTCQDNSNFLDYIVIVDESRVFQHDWEMKRQRLQWTSRSSPRPEKFRLQNSKTIAMLVTFFWQRECDS